MAALSTAPGLEVRPAREDERSALGALWYRSAVEGHPYLPRLQALSEAEGVRAFEAFSAPLELWCATLDGELVGLLGLEGDWIDRLYVAPAAQGRGVGARLLAEARALRPGGFRLYTHQKNERARRFYEARGLRPVRFGISPAPESEPDVEYRWPGEGA